MRYHLERLLLGGSMGLEKISIIFLAINDKCGQNSLTTRDRKKTAFKIPMFLQFLGAFFGYNEVTFYSINLLVAKIDIYLGITSYYKIMQGLLNINSIVFISMHV